MTTRKLFKIGLALQLLGLIAAPTKSDAQVSLSLERNGTTSALKISLVTGANGFVYPTTPATLAGFTGTPGGAAGNIAGTYFTIRVATTQTAVTANSFVGSNSYTAGNTNVASTQTSGIYTYILIDNTDAINNPGTIFAANSTKEIVRFNLTGGTGVADVEFAPQNDPVALALAAAYYGIVVPTASDIYTPAPTVTGVSSNAPLTPLPVNLLTFAATKAGTSRSLISWVTASEEAASYFEVERSLTGTASSFRSIGVRTPATGNSQTEVSYQAYDESPATGNNYYRLKMVDITGAVSYSSTRIVNFGSRAAGESVMLFPNPIRVEGSDVKLKVDVLSAQTLDYTLSSVTGQLIFAGKMEVTAGTNNYKVAGFESIAPGTYYLRVKGTTLSDNIQVLKIAN